MFSSAVHVCIVWWRQRKLSASYRNAFANVERQEEDKVMCDDESVFGVYYPIYAVV